MRNPLSETITAIPPSGIRKFFDIVSEMKDAISLGVGEPDFDTPWHIRDEGIYSLEKGRTFYTSNAGLKELKLEISRYLERRFDVGYDPDREIMVTVGGSEAIDIALRAMLDPGDEVLIPQPSYVSYVPCTILAGGVPVTVELEEKDRFRLTKEKVLEKLTPKTKILVLPFPNNPTGSILEKEDLEAIADVVREKDLFVISDEIYSELTYGRHHCTIAALPGMKERTVLINGFSKSYAMTGWRVGYLLADTRLVPQMAKLQEGIVSCVSTFSQVAAAEALKSRECVEWMRGEYARRRDILIDGINSIPGFSCKKSPGSFYAFVNIKAFGKTSDEFAEELIRNAGVVTVPGSAFGKMGEGYLRMVFANSDENLKEAVRRIRAYVEKAYPDIQ
mgnify:CR=1 FL=1